MPAGVREATLRLTGAGAKLLAARHVSARNCTYRTAAIRSQGDSVRVEGDTVEGRCPRP